jgi:DNA-binding helix-hairpin-helix protein with protein kinase domain
VGIGDIEKLLGQLRQVRSEYAGLKQEERRQQEEHGRQRRRRHLQAYLQGFEIRRAGILGPNKQAVLTACGIETAVALDKARLASVPGLGAAASDGLLDWRRSLETHFVYDSQPNEQDRQELAGIRVALQGRAAALRRTLLGGRANLEGLLQRVQAMAALRDAEIARLHAQLQQARVNLEHLGGRVPR